MAKEKYPSSSNPSGSFPSLELWNNSLVAPPDFYGSPFQWRIQPGQHPFMENNILEKGESHLYTSFPVHRHDDPRTVILSFCLWQTNDYDKGKMMLTGEGERIYVNPKQYYRIMRRRMSRAKAQRVNTGEKERQHYMHFSRHLHAKRRPRDSSGRFLSTERKEDGIRVNEGVKIQSAGSELSASLFRNYSDSGFVFSDVSGPSFDNSLKLHLFPTSSTASSVLENDFLLHTYGALVQE